MDEFVEIPERGQCIIQNGDICDGIGHVSESVHSRWTDTDGFHFSSFQVGLVCRTSETMEPPQANNAAGALSQAIFKWGNTKAEISIVDVCRRYFPQMVGFGIYHMSTFSGKEEVVLFRSSDAELQ